jgi:hypothetical protein
MKQVYEYDINGFFVGVQIVEDNVLPANCTQTKPPDGLFKAQFVNGTWVETKPQEEIDAILNAPRPKSQLELIQEALDDLILGGAL